MKVLQVIDQAFRTTVEEQDDTILWLTQSMRGAGGDLMLLLSGHGVYYTILSQRQPELRIAQWQQTQPAELTRDIINLLRNDVPVFVIQEDLAERGLAALPLIPRVRTVRRNKIPELYEQADQVWHW